VNRFASIFRGVGVEVARFDHPLPVPHRGHRSEVADSVTVNFVDQGTFGITVAGNRWDLSPATIFATYPGFEYAAHHADESQEYILRNAMSSFRIRKSH